MVRGKKLGKEILASRMWWNRLLDKVVSSPRKEVCKQRLNGHVSVRKPTECVPDL